MHGKFLVSTLLCIVILVERNNGARILGIFPLSSNSHFAMFREVMRHLADKGHKVDVVSHFSQTEPHPNYTDLSLAGSMPFVNDSITYEHVSNIANTLSKNIVDIYRTEVCDQLASPQLQNLIKNPPNNPPYDLVAIDLLYANCYLAFGRHLNVPVVGITSSLMPPHINEPLGNPLNTAYVSEFEDGSTSSMNYWQRLRNTIVTWIKYYEGRYYTEIQDDTLKKYFGPEMSGIRQLERELSLVLINTHHTLNGIRPLTPAVVEVGGLHIQEDHTELGEELESWLTDNKEGFIYVSFGSMIKIETFPEEMLLQFYTAFSKLSPLRVLMKVTEPKYLPPGLPENVLTFEWLPQMKIMKYHNVRAFITHGGLMGVQEAVTFGVPMIGIPLFDDQPINIQNCVDRGAAILLDYKDLTADKIVAAVDSVVHNPKYKIKMMELSARFTDRPMDARDTATFWIEYILEHGAASLRSPAMELTWWQVALLDVYGVILTAILITLYVVKIIFERILCSGNKSPSSSKKRN